MNEQQDTAFEFPAGKVKLDASTPVPLPLGLALVEAAEEDYSKWGVRSPYWEENIIKACEADQAYKDREAERLVKIASAQRTALRHVAMVAVVEEATKIAVRALTGVILFIAIKYAGIL